MLSFILLILLPYILRAATKIVLKKDIEFIAKWSSSNSFYLGVLLGAIMKLIIPPPFREVKEGEKTFQEGIQEVKEM